MITNVGEKFYKNPVFTGENGLNCSGGKRYPGKIISGCQG